MPTNVSCMSDEGSISAMSSYWLHTGFADGKVAAHTIVIAGLAAKRLANLSILDALQFRWVASDRTLTWTLHV